MFLITEQNKKKYKNLRIIENNTIQTNIVIDSTNGLNLANNSGLDLIVINDKKEPYICKIADFGKLKFEESKFKKEQKKKQAVVVLKEIQLKAVTSDNDISIKAKKIDEFLEDGYKVKIVVRLRGREQQTPELGTKVIENALSKLQNYSIEMPMKTYGRDITIILKPNKIENNS